MTNIFGKVLGFLTNPFAELVGGWNARKNIGAKKSAKIAIVKANAELETVKLAGELKKQELQAKIHRVQNQDDADAKHDELVLENRSKTIMDEILIIFWIVVVAMHFITKTQPFMLDGWDALGKAPWWFQLMAVIIMITTIGGMRILRLFIDGGFKFGKR